MAFWRPSTMDSWNIFSSYFWRFSNLFGQSNIEAVQIAKTKRLKEFQDEVLANAPDAANSKIICALSGYTIENAYIAPTGHLFEVAAANKMFEKHIFIVPNDEDCNHRFYEKDLYPFPELDNAIKNFNARKKNYEQAKKDYLNTAEKTLWYQNETWLSAHPKIFICPLSKKLIKEPVLTPDGKLFDKKAIIEKLTKDNKEEEICRLLPFPEFGQKLREYDTILATISNQVAEIGKGISKATKKTTSAVTGISYWLLFSWWTDSNIAQPNDDCALNNEDESDNSHFEKRSSWLCGL